MQTLFKLGAALWLLIASSTALAAPDETAVGMVLDVQGPSQLVDKGNAVKLQLLTYVRPQMQVKLVAGSKASISLYSTRAIYQITGPSTVEIGRDKLTVIDGNEPTMKPVAEKLVAAAKTTMMTPGAFRMRSMAKKIELARPEKNSVILLGSPEFSWDAMEEATYDVTLSKLPDTVIASVKVQDSNWQLPAGVKLDYGSTYSWTVSYKSAADGKVNSATSEFSTISKADADALVELKPADHASIEEWVMYAHVLQNRQLRDEARKVWGAIARQRIDLVKAQELAR